MGARAIGRGDLERGSRVLVVRGSSINGVEPRRYKAKVTQPMRAAAQVLIDDQAWTHGRRETTVPFGQLEWDPAHLPKNPPTSSPLLELVGAPRASNHHVPSPRTPVLSPPATRQPTIVEHRRSYVPPLPAAPKEEPVEEKKLDDLDAWVQMGRDLVTAAEARVKEGEAILEQLDQTMRQLEEERSEQQQQIDKDRELLKRMRGL